MINSVWPPERIEYAMALKAKGLSWAVIAERMRANQGSMQSIVSQYRKGRLSFATIRKAPRNEEIERLFLDEGWTYARLGRHFGITSPAIIGLLRRRGVDAEVRADLRSAS